MLRDLRRTDSIFNIKLPTEALPLFLVIAFVAPMLSVLPSQAQTFTVLHTLNGGSDGNLLVNGLTRDRQGNLYGTAFYGGLNNCVDNYGCGTVFKLSRHGAGWTFSVLYAFTGLSDGAWPAAPVTIAADGSVYGTTSGGGSNTCNEGFGCGTVFRLQPPPTICRAVSCPWSKTTLYEFNFGTDGAYPNAVTVDQSGNVYGTSANTDGNRDNTRGSVWELSPSGQSWTFNVIHEFTDAEGAGWPLGAVVFDKNGNLWGTGGFGGLQNCGNPQLPDDCGTIFELTPSASGWTDHTAFGFSEAVGGLATGNPAFDQSGNLYGTLLENGPNGNGGVFQYNPSSGQLNLLFAGAGVNGNQDGPAGGVVIDPSGNLYVADPYTGTKNLGFVFELTPSSGQWILTDFHDFTGGSDGVNPYGPLVLDASGNVYGADTNVIFEITP